MGPFFPLRGGIWWCFKDPGICVLFVRRRWCFYPLTGILDGPTGVAGSFLCAIFWVVPQMLLQNGLVWAQLELLSLSLQVSHSFRSSFVFPNLDTVVIVDPIRPLFDARASRVDFFFFRLGVLRVKCRSFDLCGFKRLDNELGSVMFPLKRLRATSLMASICPLLA